MTTRFSGGGAGGATKGITATDGCRPRNRNVGGTEIETCTATGTVGCTEPEHEHQQQLERPDQQQHELGT